MKSGLKLALRFVPVAVYALALCLPSYRFVSADHAHIVDQRGYVSLVNSPIGIAYLANAFFVVVVVTSLLEARPPWIVLLPRVLLWICLGLTAFGFMIGDPEPGSQTTLGPGAYLWCLALVSAALKPPALN
ncbi:MAG: hypothetical protein P4L46_14480 [Fimbriimonas sp.]|nr:hypothetical protein [Fimbriimonas sp.]